MIPEQEAPVKGVGLDNFRPLVKHPELDGPPIEALNHGPPSVFNVQTWAAAQIGGTASKTADAGRVRARFSYRAAGDT